jgi:hypothetical protein
MTSRKWMAGESWGLSAGLDSALGHDGVRIAVAKLRDDEDAVRGDSRFVGPEGRDGARATTTDHEHIHVVIHLGKIDLAGIKKGIGLQKVGHLVGNEFAVGGAHAEGPFPFRFVVRVEAAKEFLLLGQGKAGVIRAHPGRPRLLHPRIDSCMYSWINAHRSSLFGLNLPGLVELPQLLFGKAHEAIQIGGELSLRDFPGRGDGGARPSGQGKRRKAGGQAATRDNEGSPQGNASCKARRKGNRK